MKFSKQLCASADLRYLQAYIAYKDLKKAIKLITGADVECCTVRDVVSNFGGTSALTGSIFRPPESRFQDLLNLELEKINDFSRKKACEILVALDNACSRVEVLRRSLLVEHAARPSDASAGAAVHPCAPTSTAGSSPRSRAESGAALKRAFASDSSAQREQQLASDDVFHSPVVSEHSNSSNSCRWAKNGGEPDRRVEEEQADSRRKVFSSSTGVCSTSGGLGSKLNDDGGSNTEAVDGASSSHAHEDSTSFNSREKRRGGEKNIRDEPSEKTDAGDGKRRRRLHATEQQERESAAELLRLQQQLMELEGILDEQSEEVIFLDSYVRLNFTGFRKITKKYDKHNGSAAASWYMHRVVKQDFMKINFTLLLAKLASGYDALAGAAQIFQQQQNRTFEILLSDSGSDYNEGGGGNEEGSSSSSRKGHWNSSNRESDSSNDRSSSRNGSRTSSRRRDTAGDDEAQPRTKRAEGEEGDEDQRERTLPRQRGQLQWTLPHSSVSSFAAHAWTPLQHAAEESASDPQGGRVKCSKYLVPPDMLMRVKILVLKRYPLLAVHGLPVSLFANKTDGASSSTRNSDASATAAASSPLAAAGVTASAGAAPGAQTKGLSQSSSLGDSSDKGRAGRSTAAAENLRSHLQNTPARRSRSHRNTTLFDAAGGAAARAASWRVYLDDTQLSFYTAALATCPQSSWGSDDSAAVPTHPPLLLPRVRWHGQTTSLASPLSRVALDLCRVDESSASIQEDITQTYESNSLEQQCPPRTVVLQQRQLLELLRGEISSEALLEVLLKGSEEGRGQRRGTPRAAGAPGGGKGLIGAARLVPDATVALEKKTAGGSNKRAAGEAHAAPKECAPPAATEDGGDGMFVSQRRVAERKFEVQRVLDFISAAVRRSLLLVSHGTYAAVVFMCCSSRSGLVSVSIDEDIRFSRELGKSVPSSQWLRSENEALATDDVQPFPWGVLDISFIVLEEQQQHDVDTAAIESSATSAAALVAGSSKKAVSADAGAASAETPSSLEQIASAIHTANEDIQEFLARVNSLSDVILVRGFSLFLHGVAALYTEPLQEKQLQQVKQRPHLPLAIGGGEQQDEISGEVVELMRGNTEQLLPHWLQYTVAMERQEENKTPTTQRESSRLRENRDDGNAVVTAAAGSASSGNTYDEKNKSRVESKGGGGGAGAGVGGARRSNLIDVVHKGTSASLVHEWQATLEKEQSALNELPVFVDHSRYQGVGESAASSGSAGAARLFDRVPRTEGRNGVNDYFVGLLPPAVGDEAAQPTPHQEGLRQPLLTQTRGYAAAEQETQSRNRGSSLPTWLQRCGRHWLRCCTKKICCFPWANRRTARRLQQLRGGAGGAPAGAWGGGVDVSGAVAPGATVRVEPKTFFANERTLLQWMNTAVLIATISITLMNFGSPIGRIAGLIMSPVAVFFIGYSFWKAALCDIDSHQHSLAPGPPTDDESIYQDNKGPTVLVITLMCALSVVILLNVLYGGEEPPTTSTVPASPSELERPASHAKNRSKYARLSPSASPESQNEEDMYDEENIQSHSMLPFEHSAVRPRDFSSKKTLPQETTTFYRYPAAHLSSAGHPPQQRIAEAELHVPREGFALNPMLAIVSDSVRISGGVSQPVDNPISRNGAGAGSGFSDTEDAAAAPGDSGGEEDKIQDPGLRSRTKMMKASIGQKNSVRAFNSSELQSEFEAAGRMPTHSPKQNVNLSVSV